jgi:hypothetical protein
VIAYNNFESETRGVLNIYFQLKYPPKIKKIRMCLLLRSINCENCKSTEEYFETHVQKYCDKDKKKCLNSVLVENVYQTYCIMCSEKLGIEFDRDSSVLFTHITRKYLSEDEIRIVMENNEK